MSLAVIVVGCLVLMAFLMIVRRLLLLGVIVIALAGAAFSFGLVGVPSAISNPVNQIQAEVHAWQHRQSNKLVCSERSIKAAEGATESPEAKPPCK